jgi:hypothetical protein
MPIDRAVITLNDYPDFLPHLAGASAPVPFKGEWNGRLAKT